MAGIVAPWHLLAGAKNQVSVDYVSTASSFFFDKKLPRDRSRCSRFFLASFFARGLPWSLFLPGAVVMSGLWHALPAMRKRQPLLPAIGSLPFLAFFSLAVSRLEHYSLPQCRRWHVIGSLLADATAGPRTGSIGAGSSVLPLWWLCWHLLSSCVIPPTLLSALDPTLVGYGTETLVRPATLTAGRGLLGLALLARRSV